MEKQTSRRRRSPVIDLQAYRTAKAQADRTELNELLAERIVERWWDDRRSYELFNSLLNRALQGPLFTPERAKALLPTLLEVVDEMDESDRYWRDVERVNGPIVTGPALTDSSDAPA